MPAFHWIYTTWPDQASAMEAARILVSEQLCACANIQPGMTSVYAWKDNIQQDSEAVMVLKTSGKSLEALRKRFDALHPYETPCFAVLDIDADRSHQPYLDWLQASTRSQR